MNNVLLTGATGFIGSYFRAKYDAKYSIKTFSFLNDTVDTLDCRQIDVVLHLSAFVHQMGRASTEEYEKINVIQTLELAKKARNSKVKHFIFMSTIKVYGEEADTVYTESSDCNPQGEYGISKLKAEKELQNLEDENFKISIIRTPIIYGYGVKANIKNLISLVERVPVLPFAKIHNKRSMIYLGNLCHLIDEVIVQKKSGIFLASDDRPLSTTKLIESIAKEKNKKVYLVKVPFFEALLKLLKPSFHKRLYKSLEVDNVLTRERLKLKNPFTTDDGIKYMIIGMEK